MDTESGEGDQDLVINKELSEPAQRTPDLKGEESQDSLGETEDSGELNVLSKHTEERTALSGEKSSTPPTKRSNSVSKDDDENDDEEPVKKRRRRVDNEKKPKSSAEKTNFGGHKSLVSNRIKLDSKPKAPTPGAPAALEDTTPTNSAASKAHDKTHEKGARVKEQKDKDEASSENDDEEADSEEEKPEIAAKAREKVQDTFKSKGKDPYPDWPAGDPVPYAALCTTFSLIELTTKRLIISAHCSLFLRQVLRLTPQDLLPTVQLMINKLAADYAGIELGIGESLIMKAIGECTGRSLQVIKADQNEIGDLGLVAAKSRSNQPTMFKPKPLTIKGVLDGLMSIAVTAGDGSQGRKIAGIKKLLSGADALLAGKGSKGIDISKDKGGASETKFIIRFLEGKLRLGLAEKTVLVALAHAMVIHETEQKYKKLPNSEQLAKAESILKAVYRSEKYFHSSPPFANIPEANCQVMKSLFLPCLIMVSSTCAKTVNYNPVCLLNPCWQSQQSRSRKFLTDSRVRTSHANINMTGSERRYIM